MHSSYSDRGVVLRTSDSGEADRYITILSENNGLIDLYARGARRSTSRKSSHLDALSLIRFHVSRGDVYRHLDQADTEDFYPAIKSSLPLLSEALLFAEIISLMLPKEVEDTETFMSFVNYLTALTKSTPEKARDISRQFGLYLLRHLGYPPPPDNITFNHAFFEDLLHRRLISPKLNS